MSFHTVSPMLQALASTCPYACRMSRTRSAAHAAFRADAVPRREASSSVHATASFAEGAR